MSDKAIDFTPQTHCVKCGEPSAVVLCKTCRAFREVFREDAKILEELAKR